MLIVVAISGDRNMITKKFERFLTYTDFTSRRNTACADRKSILIPIIIIGTTGTIYKSFR